MRNETDVVTLPAYWASALINGDFSSFETDARELEAYLTQVQLLESDGWQVVGIADEEPRFTWNYDRYGGTARGGDVVDYIVIRSL